MLNITEMEDRKNAGSNIARRASAMLRGAGFHKAGRHSQFGGYDSAGFVCREAGNGTRDEPTAAVYAGGFASSDIRLMLEAYADVLRDEFNVVTGEVCCIVTKKS